MRLLGFILLLGIGFCAKAQPYSIDPSFQPYFDVRNNIPQGGVISDLLENNSDGSIYLVGDFDVGSSSVPSHSDFTLAKRNGQYKNTFSASIISISSFNNIVYVNDSTLGIGSLSISYQADTLGNFTTNGFSTTFGQTAPCITGYRPLFFKDGSALIATYRGSQPNSCQIYSYNDTFPHQYIVKLNPQGYFDSSFVASPNQEPEGFVKYDSTRILAFGKPYLFNRYNGDTINGLVRFFHDGTIDSSFTSPLKDTITSSGIRIKLIDTQGNIFITGVFYLKNDSSKYRTLVKLKPDGSLDSSFQNFSQVKYDVNLKGAVETICETPDGGYLIGGVFKEFQGVAKNSLAKLDSAGNIEPQYFNSIGPDSSRFHDFGVPAAISGIRKSSFGGYYVFGDFLKWNGQPSQPIIRIFDQTTGLQANSELKQQVKLYPNPSQDFISLEGLNELKIRSIQVVNLLGQEQTVTWDKNSSNSIQVEVAQLKTGIYVIQLQTEAGLIAKKFIRQ